MRRLAPMLIAVLAACSSGEEDSEREGSGGVTTVTFWRHHAEPEYVAMEELIRRFEGRHPDIRIDLRTFPYGVYTTKVVAALTTGQGPDLVNIHGSWAYGYIQSGLIVPVPEEVLSRRELDEEFFPLTRSFARASEYYAIPIAGSNLGLYYNQRMFSEAGISSPPATWSELESTALALTRRDRHGRLLRSGASLGNLRGTGNQQQWNFFVDGVLPQAGVEPVADDGRRVRWDGPEGVAALDWFTGFVRGPHATNSIMFPGAFDAFRLELSAMMIEGNWSISSLATIAPDLPFATAPLPSSDDGRRATYGSVWGNAVTSQATPLARRAAWEFLAFLAEYENMTYWATNTGEIPIRKRVLEDDAFHARSAELKAFLVQMPYARMSLKKDEGLYKSAIVDAVDEVLLNDVPPRRALRDAAPRVNAMLEER